MDEFAFVFAKPEAKPSYSNQSDFDENQIYDGKTNPLIYLRYFDLNARCGFEFTNFPFDRQRCTIWVRLYILIIFAICIHKPILITGLEA